MNLKCLDCGKEVPQTEGRRAKKFCSDSCRQKHWQKEAAKLREIGKKAVVVTDKKQEPVVDLDDAEILIQIQTIRDEAEPQYVTTSAGRTVWNNEKQRRIWALKAKLKNKII